MAESPTAPSGLLQVASPDILPAFVARHTVLIAADAGLEALEIPEHLGRALPARRREFLAGRYCARLALGALLPGGPLPDVERGADGAPLWPEGIVGSITHAGSLVSAAAARTADVRGIGIDTERLERFEKPTGVARLVLLPGEAAAGGPALPDRLRLPLVFSAKEALFKCLYPLVRRRFYFESAAVLDVNVVEGTFTPRLTSPLAPGVGPDLRLHGRFVIDDAYVHTGVWMA
jgi:enterobactin synthetase component D